MLPLLLPIVRIDSWESGMWAKARRGGARSALSTCSE
ncbi:Hypothetical Protein XCAW_02111 [Xanthomonas citri subsp. citri Aw12879]|nr:Hypothetical Protein XCAW_02111 [Xanthomonas citri subsp. citri Aw12879]